MTRNPHAKAQARKECAAGLGKEKSMRCSYREFRQSVEYGSGAESAASAGLAAEGREEAGSGEGA